MPELSPEDAKKIEAIKRNFKKRYYETCKHEIPVNYGENWPCPKCENDSSSTNQNRKLSVCKTCEKEVSKSAKTCPHCGEKNPVHRKTAGVLSSIVKVVVVLWLIQFLMGLFSGLQTDDKTTGRTLSTATSTAPSLEVQSWICNEEHGYMFVQGEVKNISNHKLKDILAVAVFRTKDGDFIKSEDALVDYNPILPNQVSPFKIMGTENPLFSKCSLSFKFWSGEQIPHKINK